MPWIIAGGAVLGGLIGSDAASSAAEAQAAAADRAAQLQKEMFEKQLQLQEPFRQAGLTAQQRYMNLLGLSQAPQTRSEAEVRNALAMQYMRPVTAVTQPEERYYDSNEGWMTRPQQTTTTSQLDQSALDAAVQAEMARQGRATQEYEAMKASPEFGKYARDFSMADFEQDPGYAFRMNEGLKALDRQAAARGGLISGGALKAAQRYGQEAASQEYTNAFNRYQLNRANQLQPLQSLMGSSQTAANVMGQSAGQYGQNAGEAYMGSGNARASGYTGGANALIGAINQGVGGFQTQKFFDRLTHMGPGSNRNVQGNPNYPYDL
jgi:hypothetical protein